MRKLTYLVIGFSLIPNSLQAGLDKYSYLDHVNEWTIERKIDSTENTVSCRASIASGGSWFGARIRLDKNDNLVYPPKLLGSKAPSELTIKKVKSIWKIRKLYP